MHRKISILLWRVAWWNKFGRPKITPLYDIGLMTWWQETEQAIPRKE